MVVNVTFLINHSFISNNMYSLIQRHNAKYFFTIANAFHSGRSNVCRIVFCLSVCQKLLSCTDRLMLPLPLFPLLCCIYTPSIWDSSSVSSRDSLSITAKSDEPRSLQQSLPLNNTFALSPPPLSPLCPLASLPFSPPPHPIIKNLVHPSNLLWQATSLSIYPPCLLLWPNWEGVVFSDRDGLFPLCSQVSCCWLAKAVVQGEMILSIWAFPSWLWQ